MLSQSLGLLYPSASPATRCFSFPCISTNTHRRGLSRSAINSVPEEQTKRDANDSSILPAGLQREFLPEHVAVILDGNARWAKKNSLSTWMGHEAGGDAFTKLYKYCCATGIPVLTVYAFSSDNWKRPQIEIKLLMTLMERYLETQLENFIKNGVQLLHIGEFSRLPQSLQSLLTNAEEATKKNKRLQLIVAVSYSGQYDITQACQSIAHKVKEGLIQPQDIDAFTIEQHLQTNCTKFPHPDLLIRTSGELRLSNFFLWQSAYTELFFIQTLWPDFGETEFLEALRCFQQRKRRYGKRDP